MWPSCTNSGRILKGAINTRGALCATLRGVGCVQSAVLRSELHTDYRVQLSFTGCQHLISTPQLWQLHTFTSTALSSIRSKFFLAPYLPGLTLLPSSHVGRSASHSQGDRNLCTRAQMGTTVHITTWYPIPRCLYISLVPTLSAQQQESVRTTERNVVLVNTEGFHAYKWQWWARSRGWDQILAEKSLGCGCHMKWPGVPDSALKPCVR